MTHNVRLNSHLTQPAGAVRQLHGRTRALRSLYGQALREQPPPPALLSPGSGRRRKAVPNHPLFWRAPRRWGEVLD